MSECFQWKGEVAEGLDGWAEEEREHLGEELSDVLLYLVRLADRCHIDLPAAALRKLEKRAGPTLHPRGWGCGSARACAFARRGRASTDGGFGFIPDAAPSTLRALSFGRCWNEQE